MRARRIRGKIQCQVDPDPDRHHPLTRILLAVRSAVGYQEPAHLYDLISPPRWRRRELMSWMVNRPRSTKWGR